MSRGDVGDAGAVDEGDVVVVGGSRVGVLLFSLDARRRRGRTESSPELGEGTRVLLRGAFAGRPGRFDLGEEVLLRKCC